MTVTRIVSNIKAVDPAAAKAFYGNIFGLEQLMDMGWITTFGSPTPAPVQISIASEGGSGTPVPDLSIEVDNLDEILQRLQAAGIPLDYGPENEPWGVRRFYVRDPFGKLLNVLTHTPDQ
ncbi:VOC family protein [Sneathiella marina]|uniref:VOC family protein n=1 Tax=Sneathiella marina TaxID=2950108 RepID=A0ABY4W8S0_9PROT|nr:VOC family protein [Sneathiella marina]USG63179.1 VOC family protein [Sneathiella marina]